MLLNPRDSFAVEPLPDRVVRRRNLLRTDHFVEIIRQPVFVSSQMVEAFHRSFEFVDFTRIVRNRSAMKSISSPSVTPVEHCRGAAAPNYLMLRSYMGTTTSNCEENYAFSQNLAGHRCLIWPGMSADDLYF